MNCDMYQKVVPAGYVVSRSDLWKRDDMVSELFDLLAAVLLKLNGDNRFKANSQSAWVHIRVTSANHVASSQTSNAFETARRGKSNTGGQLLVGELGVFLKFSEDLEISRI